MSTIVDAAPRQTDHPLTGPVPGPRPPQQRAVSPPPIPGTSWQQFIESLMIRAVEIIDGVRPLAHLSRHCTPAVLTRVGLLSDLRRQQRHARRMATRPEERAQVRSMRLMRPHDDAVECCAVVSTRRRIRAVSCRVAVREGHPTVTALDVL